MVKAILFDFWGTLVENGIFPSPVRQARMILGVERLPFPLFIIEFEKFLMTQPFEDLYKAFEYVCNEFKVKPTKEKLDMLVGMWNKNRMLAKPYPETLEVLAELRKKYRIILISNTDSISVASVMEKYDLKKSFDKIYLSCDLGLLKSNRKMFDRILEEEGLAKEDVVMVGDSIESDIIAAQNAGIKGFLVDRNNKREHPSRIKDLKELDLRLENPADPEL